MSPEGSVLQTQYSYEIFPREFYPDLEGEYRLHADIKQYDGQTTVLILLGTRGKIMPLLASLIVQCYFSVQYELPHRFMRVLSENLKEADESGGMITDHFMRYIGGRFFRMSPEGKLIIPILRIPQDQVYPSIQLRSFLLSCDNIHFNGVFLSFSARDIPVSDLSSLIEGLAPIDPAKQPLLHATYYMLNNKLQSMKLLI